MGGGVSKRRKADVARKQSRKLDQSITKGRKEDETTLKLLFLGAGESGKSTCVRQIVRLYGEGAKSDEVAYMAPLIRSEAVAAMATLVRACRSTELALEGVGAAADTITALDASGKGDCKFSGPVSEAMAALWAHPSIRDAFDRRAKFQVFDSASYFFDHAARIGASSYRPTDEDMVRCRVRTTGVVERRFTYEGNKFKIIDVGGQRSERRKWLATFDIATAVVFMVAASEYDQVLYEDETTNRLTEAVRLFAELSSLNWFRDMTFIIFLNKTDMLAEKLPHTPYELWDSTYGGDGSYRSVVQHMAQMFVDANGSTREPVIYETCVTDQLSVNRVFRVVRDRVLQEHLRRIGLVG